MNVAIIKYNAGNIRSVVNALGRLGIDPLLTDNPEQIHSADRVIFPGQGEARSAMEYLKARNLDRMIADLKQPVLGICVGQQLLCRHSEEGDVDCIGIFDVDVKRFMPTRHEDKVPAMGWNAITPTPIDHTARTSNEPQASDYLKGINAGEYVYFVHSFYVPQCSWTAATAEYILPYSACLQKDNFFTCQFHPEKSGCVGAKILENFLKQP